MFIGVFFVIITLTFLTIVRRIWRRMWAIDESGCGRLFLSLLAIPFRNYGVSSAGLFWLTSPTLQFPKNRMQRRETTRGNSTYLFHNCLGYAHCSRETIGLSAKVKFVHHVIWWPNSSYLDHVPGWAAIQDSRCTGTSKGSCRELVAESIASEEAFDEVSKCSGHVVCPAVLRSEEGIRFVRREIPIIDYRFDWAEQKILEIKLQ